MSKFFWKDVWDNKGNSNSEDFLYLDGYDHLKIEINSKIIHKKIVDILGIKKEDYILEVGCGAGFLSKEFENVYTGVDFSESIVNKNRKLTRKNSFVCEANKLFFPDNSFDYSFCFGLIQYLPDKNYFEQVINEMKRVSKKGIFLGDIKNNSQNEKHFICQKEYFLNNNFIITEQFFDYKDGVERYNAFFVE
jgi:ubiquinone/menaquinone biosynthesis C-methylase UbiE